MSHRTTASILALALFVPATALAQGVQSLSGGYRFGNLGHYFGSPCAAAGPGFVADSGTITFAANGTMAQVSNVYDVCPGGFVQTSIETGIGTYSVATEGTLLLDFNPLNPGIDTARLFLRGDGTVGLHARDQVQDESGLAVLVKLSSGRSNADLVGQYHIARQTFTNGVGVSAVSDLGVMTFNGAGGYSDAGDRRTVTATGVAASAPYVGAGAYSIAADGTLTSGTGIGALAPDGELFFYMTTNGPSGTLTVGARSGTGLSAADFAGTWGITALTYEHVSATLPRWNTNFFRAAPAALSASTGSLNGTTALLELTSAGSTLTLSGIAGQYTVAGDGSASLDVGAPVAIPARLSASGTFLVGRSVQASSSGMLLGLRRCGWPSAYGTATAGSGAIAPVLGSTGGFPYPGNSGFALSIGSGVGSGFSLLAFSFGASAGLPLLGGTMWIDPAAMITTVGVLLSGAPGTPGAGSAALTLALPPDPSLRSVQFYLQAGVLDPGAPQGVAFSPGLDLRLCR